MKLNNIPLELDNRISDIADIKTVITADENDVGKMGYFANSIHLFKNLERQNGIKYGKLIYLSDLDYGGDKSDMCFVCGNHWAYRYFIPEDVLRSVEKKYRPYTDKEFLTLFDLGKFHSIRVIGQPYTRVTIMGIYQSTDGILYVTVSSNESGYGVLWLFKHCEYFNGEEWRPFGIEE